MTRFCTHVCRVVAFLLFAPTTFIAQNASAQSDQPKLAPELAPLRAKYDADLEVLNRALKQAMSTARKTYLDAVTVAEQKATSAGRPDELKAVLAEKDTVNREESLDAVPSPLLSRELIKARTTFSHEIARIERDHAVRAREPAGNYLRGLAFLESKARGSKQTDLIEQINSEKLRIVGRVPASSGAAGSNAGEKNIIENGDFLQRQPDGTPEKWSVVGPGKGAVTAENGVTFVRFASAGPMEAKLTQRMERPPGVKELHVAVRLRCPEIKSGGYGLFVVQSDANGTRNPEAACWSTSRLRSWKEIEGVVKLRPETTELVFQCKIRDAITTVDFADVRAFGR